MISKRKLKERLIDICNGAGMKWNDEHEYFDSDPSQLECVGNVIQATERAFDLPEPSMLRNPWHLSKFDDLDEMVELVRECIAFKECQ